ncbi:MAG: glycosyltransferase family 4 protein [Chloroflexi bacterium]|nr:glycosyltransferase family 4 protein [Chloroflexota bacterium]MBU1746473.1 glycosyltransferase family 4 protein [Chloroflexota bacterium]MBU1877795.1 glycosyltransferase family 4 protein [Chloroflexota bacterium]
MKVLFVLTYYRPHVSGLTLYVQRLAKALAAQGHQVTVLTSHYEKPFPYREELDGVTVVRVPVLFRVSKGAIMPTFWWTALRLIRQHDVVSVHLPQFEAGLMGVLCRLARRPMVLTYHCDLELPPGLFNRIVDRGIAAMNAVGGALADAIVAYTHDFANHSPFLRRFRDKVRVIPPPIDLPPATEEGLALMRQRIPADGRPIVGFAARFAAEKGVEHLLDAVPLMLEDLPDLHVAFAGQYQDVMCETVWQDCQPRIQRLSEHLTFLGVIPPAEMANFFTLCDALTVPSVNSTESFGLVQVEAMLCGTPSVASNLPGVREPVRMTGMGEVVPIADPEALAQALVRVIRNKDRYVRPREEIANRFSLDHTRSEYERLFADVKRPGPRHLSAGEAVRAPANPCEGSQPSQG